MKYQNSDQRSKFLSSELALHLACKINESLVVGPINIFASACAVSKGKNLDKNTLLERIDLFRLLAAVCAPRNSFLGEKSSLEILKYASTILGVNEDHDEDAVISFQKTENQSDPFFYYANNSLPIFILPALALNFIRNRKSFSQKELALFLSALFYIAKIEYFLPWDIKDIDEISKRILSVFEKKNLVRTKDSLFQASNYESKEAVFSDELATLGTDFIECLHVVGTFLLHSGKDKSTRKFKKFIKALSLIEEPSQAMDLSLLNDRGLKIFDLIHELEEQNVYNEHHQFEPRLNDLLMATEAATDKKFQRIIETRLMEIQMPK